MNESYILENLKGTWKELGKSQKCGTEKIEKISSKLQWRAEIFEGFSEYCSGGPLRLEYSLK